MGQESSRVYRISRQGRRVSVGVGVLVIVVVVVWLAVARQIPDAPGPITQVLLGTLFLGFGILEIANAWVTRVELHADAIELHTALRGRRLARADIAGIRKRLQRWNPSAIIVVPAGSRSALELPQHVDGDAYFEQWFDGLLDLDERDRRQSLDEVMSHPQASGSEEEMLVRLRNARRGALVFTLVVLAMGIGAMVESNPRGPLVLILGLLPWAILILANRSALCGLARSRNDVRADLSAPLAGAVFLLVAASLSAGVLDDSKLIGFSLLAGIPCLALLVWKLRALRTSLRAAIFVSLCLLIYFYAALRILNVTLDLNEWQTSGVPNFARIVETDKQGRRACRVNMHGFDSYPKKETVRVRDDVCEAMSAGRDVCVRHSTGALGVRWFNHIVCPRR